MPVQRNITAHYSRNPVTIDKSRSTFNESSNLLTSFKVGDLVPLYVDLDIMPGDTVKCNTTSLLRMTTPIFPVMDNAYFDYFWFFVPNRLVWDDWAKFWAGEADPSDYTPATPPVYPTVSVTPSATNVAGYFGLPYTAATVSALPFRAYRQIWNWWFRDESTQNYLTISKASGTDVNASAYLTLQKVNKYKDWFTSGLPSPQKGAAVNILQGLTGQVNTFSTTHSGSTQPLVFGAPNASADKAAQIPGFTFDHPGQATNYATMNLALDSNPNVEATYSLQGPKNLYASMPDISVNALRLAVQTQRLRETDARAGNRINEAIYAHFGVRCPDFRLQIPEYLGGGHVTVNMMQVLQNSATNNEPSPIGTVSAYSKTLNSKFDFEKSFTEHGILMCLGCVRTAQTYQQGIDPMWFRRDRYDFYFPTLANIGEQPILNKYLYYQNNATVDNQVFAYGEAWADYRTKRSRCTGLMNSGASGSLDRWHYANRFSALPTIANGAFFVQDRGPFSQTLADPSGDDFFGNFYFEMYYTRVMPTYSVPGLVDHF